MESKVYDYESFRGIYMWNRVKEGISCLKKYILVIFTLFFCIVNWKLKVEDVVVYEDVISSAVNCQVNFPFEIVTGFELRDNNRGNQEIYENKAISFELSVFDENENIIWNEKYDNIQMTSSYFVPIVQNMSNQFRVNTGEKYFIKCRSEEADLTNVSVRFLGAQKNFQGIYVGISIVAILILTFAIKFLRFQEDGRLHKFVLIMVVSLGIMFNLVSPPLSVPDEAYHLSQSWAVSDRILGIENGTVLMVPESINYVRYCQVRQSLYSFYDHLWDEGNKEEYIPNDQYVRDTNLPWYTYLLPGIGIAIGRLSGLNFEWLMIIGRMMNLLLSAVVLSGAVRILPFGKKGMLSVIFFPMTISLLGSMSYDAINLSFLMLFFSVCMCCIYKADRISIKDIIILAVIATIFVPIKVIYFSMLLLVFLIPMKKYGTWRRWTGGSCFICMCPFVALIAQEGKRILSVIGASYGIGAVTSIQGNASTLSEAAEPTYYTIGWALSNPLDTIKIFIRSIYENGDSYLLTAIGSRFNDVSISMVFIFVLLIAFILLSLSESGQYEGGVKVRGIAIFISLAILLLAMTSMFFAFTDFGSYSIKGVQGRYLLPIFILFPLILNKKILDLKKNMQIRIMHLMVFFDILTFFSIFTETLRW